MWIDDKKQSLDDKLEVFDRLSNRAALFLFPGLDEDRRAELITLARERHIDGHYVHGDSLLYEYSAEELKKERDEELADGVVYEVRRLFLSS